MHVDATMTADIRRPRAEVSAFVGDPTTTPLWRSGVRSVEPLSEGPVSVGSRLRLRASSGGSRDETVEVTELVPGVRLTMTTVGGGHTRSTTYSFEDLRSGATRMTWHAGGSPRALGPLFAPLLRRVAERGMARDLRVLTRRLEAR